MKKPQIKTKTKSRSGQGPDDFVSVARRLGADEDKARFEAKLGKIAKATGGAPPRTKRAK